MNRFRPLSVLLAGLTLAFAGPAPLVLAADEVEAEIQDKAEAYNDHLTNDRNKLVCKKEAVTGSRIKKTVCRSQASMENSEYQAKRFLDEKKSGIRPPGGG